MPRLGRFVTAGAVGFLVQTGLLAALLTLTDMHYAAATALAVEAAILTNFRFHDQWTWGDRPIGTRLHPWGRLARFNGLSLAALLANVTVTAVLVEFLGVTPIAASVLAVCALSGVNFIAADRYVFRA